MKSFILNGMEDLKLQVYQDITNLFAMDQFYDAHVLASDIHSKSQIFVAEMTNWIVVFYQELLTTLELQRKKPGNSYRHASRRYLRICNALGLEQPMPRLKRILHPNALL